MVKIRLTVDGAEAAAERLEGIDQRTRVLTPLLTSMGQILRDDIRRHLRQGQPPPEITWPNVSAVTKKIRKFYGHDRERKLRRGGQLLESIRVLEVRPRGVSAGTDLPYARTLQSGGTTRLHSRTLKVQAFPFVHAHRQLIEDALGLTRDYLLGDL